MKKLQSQSNAVQFLAGLGFSYGLYNVLFLDGLSGLLLIGFSIALVCLSIVQGKNLAGKKLAITSAFNYVAIMVTSGAISFMVVSDYLSAA
jgi:hypothetical protein